MLLPRGTVGRSPLTATGVVPVRRGTTPGPTPQTVRRARRPHTPLAAAGVLLLGGCSLLPSDDDPPTTSPAPTTGPATPKDGIVLPEGTKEVAVPLDETVQIALPDGSPGVGDLWGVASIDDPTVV